MTDSVDYDRWYPDVPPVMDAKQLAELLHTNEQIIRAWVREGIIPAHRKPGGRKFTFLRHEIFDWLISNRYEPEERRGGRFSTSQHLVRHANQEHSATGTTRAEIDSYASRASPVGSS